MAARDDNALAGLRLDCVEQIDQNGINKFLIVPQRKAVLLRASAVIKTDRFVPLATIRTGFKLLP